MFFLLCSEILTFLYFLIPCTLIYFDIEKECPHRPICCTPLLQEVVINIQGIKPPELISGGENLFTAKPMRNTDSRISFVSVCNFTCANFHSFSGGYGEFPTAYILMYVYLMNTILIYWTFLSVDCKEGGFFIDVLSY